MSESCLVFFFFFFFQAEDGIRDVAVTGVQTCALPICRDDVFPDRLQCLYCPSFVGPSALLFRLLQFRSIDGEYRPLRSAGAHRIGMNQADARLCQISKVVDALWVSLSHEDYERCLVENP